ncbi:NADH:flavin oxidoreductase, partial [bacterium]|nr:NADH:flavin oxidoreductase [bacterium]
MNVTDKIIRSATIENFADENGVVDFEKLGDLYNKISAKTIITGFNYVSENGRAMQKFQAGLINDQQENAWKELVKKVKSLNPNKRLIIQLAHTGRQTTRKNAVGVSNKKCTYFRTPVHKLTEQEIFSIVQDFANSAYRAKRIGFDGIQIHAAHGYLIHQFLSSHTNNRKDKYKNKCLFLIEILEQVRKKCGDDFPIWIKISWGDDSGLTLDNTIEILKYIDNLVDNIEISYGTMEYALNIIRGG